MRNPNTATTDSGKGNTWFGNIDDDGTKRFFQDRETGRRIVKVFQGEWYVSCIDEIISTILGSCISACIRDPLTKVGGINHFLLPYGDMEQDSAKKTRDAGLPTRYGNFAMEQLINEILKRGGDRKRLEVKVFGGGNVLAGGMDIGHKNADFIEDYLSNEGLKVVSKSLRGVHPRMIRYFPESGKVMVRTVDPTRAQTIAQQEYKKRIRIAEKQPEGDIELFD
ncbi:chemoreceptor glutamine deamidase CheD [Hwanghaeella grinnelliae]|uniref:chemoreceptor glutamine deamidase CheD n=1 Tax=Hwanghaeella grinnelliae TaxID=2500179 RepID=UPI0018751138|nr:chemoreceptor glutamine deamidase CheD [Hwanghaeella grinnelliae]